MSLRLTSGLRAAARARQRIGLACLASCCGFGLCASPASAVSLSFTGGPLPTPRAPLTNDLEPGIAASGNGTFVIGATAGGRGADIWVSDNNGQTYRWVADPFQNPPQGANPENGQDTDVTAAPTANGSGSPNLYATSLYSANSSIAVSHDNGKTWQVDQLGGTPSQDRPWLAADGPCTVYLAYQNGDSGPPSREMVSRFDACQTPVLTGTGAVLNPVQAPTDPYPLGAFLGGKIQVDNSTRSPFHHQVYIPTGGCETDLPGPSYLPTTNPFDCQFARATLSIAVSSDGGQSFVVHRVADSTTHELQIWPDDLGIDSSGELYLVWGDNHNVYLNTSTDGGRTWSHPRMVNVPPALSAVHPTVAASAPGHLEIAWYGADRNGDSNNLKLMGVPGAPGAATWRVYVAKSTDYGRHFDQVAVSSVVHTGIVCTTATTCTTSHSRNLFDDFGIAISPTTHLASVAYTIDNPTIHPQSASTSYLQIGYATELPARLLTCVGRRAVTVKVHAKKGDRIVRVEVYLGRRRLRDLRGRNIKQIRIRLPRLTKRTFRITIVAHTARGTRIVTRRTFRNCGKRHPRA